MNAERGTRNAAAQVPHPARHILVCFALKEEAGAFGKQVAGRNDVFVLLTGIGRTNAERTVRGFLERSPGALVLTCGFAGGLNPELKIGDVIFLTVDPTLDASLDRAGAKPAGFFCSSRMVTTAREKAELRQITGADAVEMESEAIHALCRERGLPCATVRVISDTADEDLPLDFNQVAKSDLSLDYRKLALAIAKSPGTIPALLRLQRNCRFAAQRLADTLVQVI